MTGIHIKRVQRDRHRTKSHVEMEVEMGVMSLQNEKCQGVPASIEVRRGGTEQILS